ncbi:FAD-binding oxidoreductase [Microlunatus speluncae]|uniref:FAD-binding oxidoreductase n=1 Tax=Microlunatus speluncae TaxID=2594267 RepID=UPI001266080B|nr:FAD-binding oxidoreductase [Microlunatus speluncae]
MITGPDVAVTARAAEAAAGLRPDFAGPVLLPGEPGYDEARTGWNRTIDSTPAVIAVARSRSDVQVAVRVARRLRLPLAVQSTGHGTLVPADGALLLKLSGLDEVRIDVAARTATVGPGATWHQVNRATAEHGLASLAGRCGTVGVVGYTLGGGAAWLSRTFGYAADSVLAAEVVTATGELVGTDAETNPDLFWALRGGGGNFGIVTSLTFRLYDAPSVFSGLSFFPADRGRALLAAYRDWTRTEPEALNTAVLLLRVPPAPVFPTALHGRPVVALRATGLVDEPTGRATLRPLLDVAGEPLLDGFALRDFAAASTATNGPDAPPMPHRQLVQLYDRIDDDLLDLVVGEGLRPDAPYAFVELRHWGGAMARPGPDAGPAGHRQTPYSVLAVAPYLAPDRAAVDVPVDRFDDALAARATGGSFLNLLTDPARTATAFTPDNHRRLRRIKRRWDPADVFRPSHHIPPAPADT